MTHILDGKKARDHYTKELTRRVSVLAKTPILALIQVGNNRESSIYIDQKKKFAEIIGAKVEHIHLDENTSQELVREHIETLNKRSDISGIILQLPIPQTLDKDALIERIAPYKDVDGLTSENQRLLTEGKPCFIPATAKGVGLLLDFYKIDVKSKNTIVFGRSRLVGFPVSKLLEQKGAKVSVCHSQTENPKEISLRADIVIVAIGKPELIDASYIKKGAVVIDVGINSIKGDKFENELPKRKVVGDVDFKSVSPHVSAISPVPGGVGPMTVLSLFDNLVTSAEKMTV